MKKKQIIYLIIKRGIDILLSIIAIICCFVLIWWWVFIINTFVTKGHPFFVHKRFGKEKKIFKLFKFRSMKLNTDPNLPPYKLSNNDYKKLGTKFGNFLRKTSIDETPQFINVLIGNMSLIGPRPGSIINEEELVVWRERFKPCAYEIRPGITGYAQIKTYKNHNSEFKAKYDSLYIKNISFCLDIKIFLYTLIRLVGLTK